MNEYKSFDYDYIYKIFKYKILIEDYPMCKILGYEQGIDNYLARLARDNNLYNNFIDQATSQRYTKSRIKRLVLNYILDNTMELNNLDLSFVKVLAYNNKATENFNNLANKLNIVINKSDLKKLKITDLLVFNKMIEASNFYNLGIGREIDYDFRHNNRPI